MNTIARVTRTLTAIVDTASVSKALDASDAEARELGLNFSDPDDRATFRGIVGRNLEKTPMAKLDAWLAENAPSIKLPTSRDKAIRLFADMHMHVITPSEGPAAPRRQAPQLGGDVTSRLSRQARDAGFTLTSRTYQDTETGGTKYAYTLLRHGQPVRRGRDVYTPKSVREADMVIRSILEREAQSTARSS